MEPIERLQLLVMLSRTAEGVGETLAAAVGTRVGTGWEEIKILSSVWQISDRVEEVLVSSSVSSCSPMEVDGVAGGSSVSMDCWLSKSPLSSLVTGLSEI